MDWLTILFRATHVPAAIIWAGGAIFFSYYVEPTLAKLGPNAQPFADEIINKRKAPVFFAIAATLTVVGGAFLYIKDAGGLQLWTSPSGWVFTIGAVCGIIAWASGFILLGPAVKKVGEIGAEMQAAQDRVRQIGQIDTWLIIIAIFTMATARYFG